MKKIKRLFSFLIVSILIFGSSVPASAQVHKSSIDEETSLITYQQVMEYAQTNDIPLNMSYKTFMSEYQAGQYSNLDEYADVYYDLLEPQITTKSGGGDKWYYNTGTSLPQPADYSRYNLLDRVQKGDIIFEANGGFGITAHIAIVEGIYYDNVQNQNYIRIVEAIDDGVVRSVLDDQRVDDKAVYLYRVIGATNTTKVNAINFCISQLGKSYYIDFSKDTSSSEPDWYCSELVWAAYYNQGIDIETSNLINEPGVTPRDIVNGTKVGRVPF